MAYKIVQDVLSYFARSIPQSKSYTKCVFIESKYALHVC